MSHCAIAYYRVDAAPGSIGSGPAGLDALGWYHEKHDEHRGIGLGPEHDWASHAADAFGLMCIAYETPADDADHEDDEQTLRAWRDLTRSAVTGY